MSYTNAAVNYQQGANVLFVSPFNDLTSPARQVFNSGTDQNEAVEDAIAAAAMEAPVARRVDNKWYVRTREEQNPGETNSPVVIAYSWLTDYEFSVMQTEARKMDTVIYKMGVRPDGAVTLARYQGGLLQGDNITCPSVQTFHADGRVSRRYHDQGQLIADMEATLEATSDAPGHRI